MLSLAEELAAVDDHCEPVGRPALNTHWGTRPTISAGCDKLRGIKQSAAPRTSRREAFGVERILVGLRFALKGVASGARGWRIKRVNDFGHMVDEVSPEMELDLVVAIGGIQGVVEGKGFEGVAETARTQ